MPYIPARDKSLRQWFPIIPENAPNLPVTTSYTVGTQVGIANDISLNGYSFSGWTTSDVIITNNKFDMPEKQVVLKGIKDRRAEG